MARRDLPCASCGEMMWRSSTSLPDGMARCQPCRRAAAPHGYVRYTKGCRCDECRIATAAWNREYRSRRKAEGRPINYAEYRSREERTCEQCSAEFLARPDNPGRFCSVGCANTFQGGSGRPRREDRFRISESRRLAIYERDDWTCQVCGEPVDREANPTGPWFPSIDHIVPRSLGGSDDDTNLRLAHRWCNSVRGNLSHYTDADLQGVS